MDEQDGTERNVSPITEGRKERRKREKIYLFSWKDLLKKNKSR